MSQLLDDILEMDLKELRKYVTEKSEELGIEFDYDMLDGDDRKQALYDFIADNIHTDQEFVSVLHSECQITPGCNMFPNAEDEEDLEELMGHE